MGSAASATARRGETAASPALPVALELPLALAPPRRSADDGDLSELLSGAPPRGDDCTVTVTEAAAGADADDEDAADAGMAEAEAAGTAVAGVVAVAAVAAAEDDAAEAAAEAAVAAAEPAAAGPSRVSMSKNCLLVSSVSQHSLSGGKTRTTCFHHGSSTNWIKLTWQVQNTG